MATNSFSITFHYNDKFIFRPIVEYIERQTSIYDRVDLDKVSISKLEDMLEKVGISNFFQFYHIKLEKDLNNILKFIFRDQDILQMISDIQADGMIYFYIEHVEESINGH